MDTVVAASAIETVVAFPSVDLLVAVVASEDDRRRRCAEIEIARIQIGGGEILNADGARTLSDLIRERYDRIIPILGDRQVIKAVDALDLRQIDLVRSAGEVLDRVVTTVGSEDEQVFAGSSG